MSRSRVAIAAMLILAVAHVISAAEPGATQPTATPPGATQPAERNDVEVTVTRIAHPTRITATVENAPAVDLFFRLARAGEVTIAPQQEGLWEEPTLQGAMFNAEWKDVPLWDAVAEACEATGLKPSIDMPSHEPPRIRLEKSPPKRAPFIIDGPALLRVLSIVRSASIGYGAAPRADDRVRLTFQLLLEPRLRRFAWVEPIRFDRAVDNRGNAIPIPPVDREPGQAYQLHDLSAVLGYPPKAGDRITELRGSVRLHIVKELATIEFDDPFARPRELAANVGPHRLVLQPITGDATRGWEVKLKLHRGTGPPDPHWKATAQPLGSLGVHVHAVDPRGPRNASGGSSGWQDDNAHVDVHFPPREGNNELTALRLELPVSFTTIDVKFEFKDLPLP